MAGTSEGGRKAAETRGHASLSAAGRKGAEVRHSKSPEEESAIARKAAQTRGHESLSEAGRRGGQASRTGIAGREDEEE